MKINAFSGVPLVMALLVVSAVARPRDDGMASAYRCAAIANSRQWLDCYYGAAQPVRARLGLVSAPASQLSLAASPTTGGEPQNQDIRDQVIGSAAQCHAFTDDRGWLNCYYAAAAPMRSRLGLSPSAASVGPLPVAASAHGASPEASIPAQGIHSRMTNYHFDDAGIFTVTLANGQIWRQLSGDTDLAHWNKPAQTYAISINHGFLGSYNMTVPPGGKSFKVKRVE